MLRAALLCSACLLSACNTTPRPRDPWIPLGSIEVEKARNQWHKARSSSEEPLRKFQIRVYSGDLSVDRIRLKLASGKYMELKTKNWVSKGKRFTRSLKPPRVIKRVEVLGYTHSQRCALDLRGLPVEKTKQD
jgi:hypothetical protein